MAWIHENGRTTAVSDNLLDVAQIAIRGLGPVAEIRLLSEKEGIEIHTGPNQKKIIRQRMKPYTCLINEEIRDGKTVLVIRPKWVFFL